GQQVALVSPGHHEQLRPEALGADGGGDLLEQRDELGRRIADEGYGHTLALTWEGQQDPSKSGLLLFVEGAAKAPLWQCAVSDHTHKPQRRYRFSRLRTIRRAQCRFCVTAEVVVLVLLMDGVLGTGMGAYGITSPTSVALRF
ncbi:MAG: hypothetical protein LC808_03780, partial [Actinobacteria bacterium]|nr:hypothetical protein [Actinomycetota bacterium]